MSKIKIAIFVHGLSGGVGKVLLNYFTNMPSNYELDLITMYIESKTLLDEFEKNGFNVIKIPSKKESITRNLFDMFKILKRKKYDIAYAHMTLTNCFPLFIAKICGINVRISHSHLAEKSNIYTKLLGTATRIFSTDNLACSNEAGYFLYGNRKFKILNNAINLNKYKFNSRIRDRIRKKYNIGSGTTVIGNVGRFSNQKNQKFVVDVFSEYHKINKNSMLLFIGEGIQKNSIIDKVKKLKIEDSVLFLGQIKNVHEVLQAMDIFLQPSLFEGLSLAAVEAQASGLPCVLSDTVSKETKIIPNVSFISLNSPLNIWVKQCQQFVNVPRHDVSKLLRNGGYDIKVESMLFDRYLRNKVNN